MPIYEYACSACEHRADILHGINDAGPNFCPSCGKEGTMRKQFALPTIHFKGSGWAKKDRGGSAAGTKASRSASSSGEPGSSSDSGLSASSDASSSSPSSSSSSSPISSSDGPKPSSTD